MKKAYRFLCIVLVMMLAWNLAACSKSTKKSNKPSAGKFSDSAGNSGSDKTAEGKKKISPRKNKLPITTENIKLVLYDGFPTGARQIYSSMAETDIVKKMMKETGLQLEFVHAPEGDDGTFFNTMIASESLPDILRDGFGSYPGGPMAAMDDGILLDATDLIDKYAYYYNGILDQGGPELRRRVMSDDGRYKLFGVTFLPEYLDGVRHGGFLTRQDLLDKVGITKLPVTMEEYEKMFDAYLGLDITPWAVALSEWQFNDYAPVASAYGVRYSGFQLRDGKVTYSRCLPEYKDFLKKMAEWVKKGYISSDAFNQKAADAGKSFQAGTAGAVLSGSWENITRESVGKVSDPSFEIVGLALPRLKEDDMLTTFSAVLSNPEMAPRYISAGCKHPEEAVRFVDYLYKQETMKMTAWGVNTKEHTLWKDNPDGSRSWTDFMVKNPEVDYETMRQRYTFNPMQGMWDTEMEKLQYEIPQVQQPWSVWSYNTDDSDVIPKYVTRTAEEERELNTLMDEIDTYSGEMVQKFISGQEPLDHFDNFVKQLEKLGIERACEIHQQAYERYLDR